MSEQVNHPSHYCKDGRKECIVEMEEKYGIPATVGFCLMNAYKYLYRAGYKADNSCEQDVKKAKWYFDYANKLIDKDIDKERYWSYASLFEDIKVTLESKETKKPINGWICVVAKEINGQEYVRLEDFLRVVNDLQEQNRLEDDGK